MYMCVLEVKNTKFSEKLYVNTKGMPQFGKDGLKKYLN